VTRHRWKEALQCSINKVRKNIDTSHTTKIENQMADIF
jgi:hypothetical protein